MRLVLKKIVCPFGLVIIKGKIKKDRWGKAAFLGL